MRRLLTDPERGGDGNLTLYRVYRLDATAEHITGPPIDIDAPDDLEAVEQAKQFLNGKPIELWQGARCVERLYPLHGAPLPSPGT